MEQHRLPGKTQPAYIVHQNKWVRVHHPWYYMQQILPKRIILNCSKPGKLFFWLFRKSWKYLYRFYEILVIFLDSLKPGKNLDSFKPGEHFSSFYETW